MERRLAAILAADVVGYTRLMGIDEADTLRRVKDLFGGMVRPAIQTRGGRVVKLMGDGLLAEFPSVIQAVQCAVDVQLASNASAEVELPDHAIRLRIGVNVGDIIVDGDDIFGDGVNVASRLEALAEPGGICISRAVRDQIRDKLDFALEDCGEIAVKNVPRPVRVFRVSPKAGRIRKGRERQKGQSARFALVALVSILLAITALAGYWLIERDRPLDSASVTKMAVPLPNRPSIAVLPFRNLSGEEQQRYFAEGITEDIIADLSKVSGILVVAHGSSRAYQDERVDISKVAEDLGVHHVLTGSIRRSGEQLRATVQLVDAIKGTYVWSEKYDRKIDDVFAVQSEIAQQVVKAMSVTLKASEHDRLFHKYATNIDAYDAFLKARAAVDAPTRVNVANGEALFRRAIEFDPKFAAAYAGLSFNYSVKARFRFGPSPEEDARESLQLATKAVELDANLPWSHIALAGAFLANGRHDDAVDAAQRALTLQPNGYEANLFAGFYLNFAGRAAQAVKYLEVANELSRIDTIRGLDFLGMAYFTDGQYSKCEETWRKRFKAFGTPEYPHAHIFLSGSQAAQNRLSEAALTVERFLKLMPNFKLSQWRWINNYKNLGDRKRLYDAAIKAGVPE